MGAIAKGIGSVFGGIGAGVQEGAGATNTYKADNPYLPQYLQQQIAQQNEIYGGQNTLAQALQAQMAGTGPNPAQTQFLGNTQSNIANAQGLIASQRGLNPALAARMGASAAAAANQQAAMGSAILQQQQQLGATQNLQSLYAQMANANLGYQQNYRGAEATQQQINQGVASQNAQQRAQLAAGAMQAAASGTAMAVGGGKGGQGGGAQPAAGAAHGGKVMGKANVPGDSPANDTVDAKLSPGEIVVPRSMASNPDAAKRFIDALFESQSGQKQVGYGDVLKAKQSKKKVEDSLKMYDGGAVEIGNEQPPSQEDIERYKFQNPDPMKPLSYESAITGKSLGREFLGDTAAPVGSGEVRPSWDAMDLLPPEKMGAAAIAGAKALAGHLAATKGAAGMLPLAAGAIRKTGGGTLLGTVSKDALEKGAEETAYELGQQGIEAGFVKSGREAVKATEYAPKGVTGKPTGVAPFTAVQGGKRESLVAPDNEIGSLVDRIKYRFGDSVSPEQWEKIHNKSLASNSPYVPVMLDKKHAGFYPNPDVQPTGVIGNPKKFVNPAKIFKDAEQLNWHDSKYGVTKELIKKHAEQGIPLNITTASDLLAHDDYMSILPRDAKVNFVLPQKVGVGYSEGNLATGMPSNKRLLIAADKLQKHGIQVNIMVPDPKAKTLKQLDPFTVKKLKNQEGAFWEPKEAAE